MHTLLIFAALIAAPEVPAVPDDAAKAKPLTVGTQVPDGTLVDLAGETTTLKAALGGKPTVLVLYRGGWCPFCNAHLAELAKNEDAVREAGYQIVAVSPDTAQELGNTDGKLDLGYRLFSDSDADLMRAFGVAFRVDDATYLKYKETYGLDLEVRSGATHHYLPVPSVFVIDAAGTIRFVHSNPDYSKRLSGEALRAAIRAR